MGRNIAKSITQMSHCPKYSLEFVFLEVTTTIVNVIALHFAINSRCSVVNSGCRGVISQSCFLLLAKFEPRFLAIFDVSWCPSIFSQPSLLYLFFAFFAPAFLARSHHIIGSSWRSLKSMLSSQATSFSFWCSWKVFHLSNKFSNRSTLPYLGISPIYWSCDDIVFWGRGVSSTFYFSFCISHSTSSASPFAWLPSTKRETRQKLFQ